LPSTPEAARLYSDGITKLRIFDAPAAQVLLARAVAVDPNFALGHSALASAWSELGYDEKAKAEARRAFDLSLNLSRQVHLAIAGQYSELTRDWDQAVSAYQQLAALFPDSVDYGVRLANAQTSAGRGEEALSTLEKLRKLPAPASGEPQIDLAQANAADSLGNFKLESAAAERAIERGVALSERLLVARSWTKKSWALWRLGDGQQSTQGLHEAKRIFSEAGDTQGVGSTVRLAGLIQSEQGNFAEAARSYQDAIAIFRRISDRRSLAMSYNGFATVQYERGDLRGARLLYEKYYEIEKEVGSKINAAAALGNIANVANAQGNLAEALRLNEESLKIFAAVGDQRAAGTALGNLAILLYEQGDLEGAKTRFGEALDIKRKIGYQRGIAYDLSGLGEISRAEGDLATAHQEHQEALNIRNKLGEKHNAAASRLYLAIIALESQEPAEAEKIAAESADEFREEKSTTDEASAEEVRARILLAESKLPEAHAAISRATVLARGASNLPLSFDIAATSACISMAGKHPSNPSTANSAKKNLESSLAIARKCGYLEYEYKLSVALGQIELQSGDARQGRARLETIASEANSKGFKLAAREATSTLSMLGGKSP
jgi:tetratricopeptide (TPR) repeat protein